MLATLAAAEVALRLFGVGVYARRVTEYHFLQDPDQLGWCCDAARPPEQSWDGDPYGRLPPGARMTYEISAAGLRGPLPQPGRPVVLVLGDSFTFGEGVLLRDTFVARVEGQLAPRSSPAPALVNAGMPGFSSFDEQRRLPSLLARFGPRAVVLVYVPNDPIPVTESVGSDDLVQAAEDVRPTVHLWALLRDGATREERNRAVEAWYESFYFGERSDHWAQARRALLEMRDRSRAQGATFGVVFVPILYRLDERPMARIEGEVRGACDEMGAPFLDLTPVLAREPDRALWVHPADHHPDARANELAADAITPFVESLLR